MFKASRILRGVRLYGKFTKIEKQADGTLYVEGIASSEAVDSAGEVVKASAMRGALPDYLKFPALREMHQLKAAGKTIAADVLEDGSTYIAAKVVDPVACLKVEEGVYAGFSIGGEVPPGGRNKDNAKIIETLKLFEISLVDRPANPLAVISLVKIEDASAQVPAAAAAKPATTEGAKAASAEASPAAQGGASATSAKPADPARKGMFSVGWAADLCGQLAALSDDVQWEALYEGDDSKIPARLKALCAELAGILKDLVAEEADELVAAEKIATAEAATALVNTRGKLKKTEKLAAIARVFLAAAKGASAADPERIVAAEQAAEKAGDALRKVLVERDDLHQKLADATLLLKAKGVPRDPKHLEATVKAEELQKAVVEAQDATEKAGGALKKVMVERDELLLQRDALQKQFEESIVKHNTALTELGEEKAAITRQRDEYVTKFALADVQLKTKGYLKAVPIAKADDTRGAPEPEGDKPAENTPERVLYELKKVQRAGPKPLALGTGG